MVKSVLIDRHNKDELIPLVADLVSKAAFIGLDTETHDDNRHDGLNDFCGYDPVTRRKAATKPLVFDFRRIVMTGFSVYPEGHDTAYYINLNHADVGNRVPWEEARMILDARGPEAFFIAHNAPFELTVFKSCYNYELPRTICSMQMLVSAYGPDEYDTDDFIAAGRGDFDKLIPDLIQKSIGWQPGTDMPAELEDTVYKILSKQSTSSYSYNGFVKNIAYGYGLKNAVKRHFGVTMTTFEECLKGRAHMGELTGQEVVEYGADDAYWAVMLFHHTMKWMVQNCPETIETFFEQENPMIYTFSDIAVGGMRVNMGNIQKRRTEEREHMAQILRDFKVVVKKLLPFPSELNPLLLAAEKSWYGKNGEKYRQQIVDWAHSPDFDDAFDQCMQVRSPVSNAWATELGQPESKGINFSHYMPMRVLLYDLLNTKPITSEGKVQSDGEARGRLKDRFEKQKNELAIKVVEYIGQIAGVDQRMKLYLNPYTKLADPETGCMYPIVSSMLATRRMAASYPNPMQLAKRGESTYVRGFFLGDTDEHVVVSIDWSAIELVIIAELSGDPEFVSAYSDIPHKDLHAGSAASVLQAAVTDLTPEMFKALHRFEKWEDFHREYGTEPEKFKRLATNLKGEALPVDKAYKYWRTEAGKASNFGYWYSGWLADIGSRMRWSQDQTALAVEKYRQRFPVAEKWRLETIHELASTGRLILPDGHYRRRYEATNDWMIQFLSKFELRGKGLEAYHEVVRFIARKIQKRAHNQGVNAMVQGTCATIAKRSQQKVDRLIKSEGYNARFLMPIHDELLWSVHHTEVADFVEMARGVMIDHPDLFKLCKLDASPAVGITFEPWHATKAPLGQVELFEAPPLPVYGKDRIDQRLDKNEITDVVKYLMEQRRSNVG